MLKDKGDNMISVLSQSKQTFGIKPNNQTNNVYFYIIIQDKEQYDNKDNWTNLSLN